MYGHHRDEGRRDLGHPLIHFVESSRRTRSVLAGTPLDVWQVIVTYQAQGEDPLATARALRIPLQLVQAAVDYYDDYPEEILPDLDPHSR